MKKLLFTFAAIAALLASCTIESENQGLPEMIRAEIGSLSTRVTLAPAAGGYNVNWVVGDRIGVSDGAATAIYEAVTGGSTTADFKKVSDAPLSGTSWTGYYPAELATGVLPAVQTYSAEGAVAVPMVSDPTYDVSVIKFKPVTGVLQLNISSGVKTKKIKEIRVKADQGLSGNFILKDGAVAVSGTEGVTLDCGEGVVLGVSAPFYVTVPAATYTGMEIIIFDTDGNAAVAKLQENTVYTVRCAELRTIDITADKFAPLNTGGEATLMYGPDFNETIKHLIRPDCMAIDNDSTITHIVFKTCVLTEGDVLVSDSHSENPVWASFDKATGTVTITTPADVIYTDKQASHMFRGFCLVKEIENLKAINTSRAENLSYFFHRCFNLRSVDLSNFETSNCDCFGFMFSYCQSLESLDVSRFNTEKAITFANMFQHCENVEEIDVSGFRTANVRSLDNTFSDCYKLKSLDLSKWNTDNVTDTRSMFNRCRSIKELDMRQMSFPKTTRMTYMFYNMDALEVLHFDSMDFSRWIAGSGTALLYMLQKNPNLKEIYLGEKGVNPYGIVPNPFFCSSSDADGVRTSSNSGSLTIHCHKDAVNWLAKGTLRWLHSGYKNQKPIDVKFLDYKTGEEYTATWAAN